ncbi:MAG: (2Fe-2S)-binding protein [Clostridia bacterium]
MLKTITMRVNGSNIEIAVDERESLADTLRERLGLKSVKKGCEAGECGACTVLIDGRATNTCMYLSMWANGCDVLTLEGLAKDGILHPLQQAFIDEAAVQCGFCTPGLIMAGVEMVNSGKTYTRGEIRKRISGHLCRCTGYENIVNAIASVVGCGEEDV